MKLLLGKFCYCSSFHGLDPLVCCDSELTSEIMGSFKRFSETSWMEDQYTTEKCSHTSIPRAGFESMIPLLEKSKAYGS